MILLNVPYFALYSKDYLSKNMPNQIVILPDNSWYAFLIPVVVQKLWIVHDQQICFILVHKVIRNIRKFGYHCQHITMTS